MSSRFGRLFLLGLTPLVGAYTIFETTCSAPAPSIQSEFIFVSAPNTRGTLDILWSSLFTIFACTWTLQHNSLPGHRNSRRDKNLGDQEWARRGYIYNVNMMYVTLLAPEYVIGIAWDDLIKARNVLEKMKEFIDKDKVPWTLRHSHFAKMGGFGIRSKQPLEASGILNKREVHCLSAWQVYELRRTGVIESLPDITTEEIKDKSKSDIFSKVIAVGQILWTIIQIIARAAKKLPVCPLEIAVAAFAVCAVIIHGLYLYKPQRVSTPIVIYDYPGEETKLADILDACFREASEISNQASLESGNTTAGREPEITEPETTVTIESPKPVTQRADGWDGNLWEQLSPWLAGGIGAAVFGAIHILAWNFAFPTKLELIWWRCASVYTAAFPVVFLVTVVAYITPESIGLSDRAKNIVQSLLVAFITCTYMVARLFILVEMFRTLFFLPAGSFVSPWSTNIPHFG